MRPSTAGLSGTSFAAPIVTGIAARYLTGGTRSIAWPLWIANYFRDRGDEARALYGDAVRTRGDLKGATDNAAWFKNICRTESPWY